MSKPQQKPAPTVQKDDFMDEEEEEEQDTGYKWEKEFERTWEQITEDERGLHAVSEKKRKYEFIIE